MRFIDRFKVAVSVGRAILKGEDPRAVMARRAQVGGIWTQPMARLPIDSVNLAEVERTNPTIGRAVAVIAEDAASVPLTLVRESVDGKKHTAVPDTHPAVRLFRHINAVDTPYDYFVGLFKDLLVFGNHYDHAILDDRTGEPLSLWRLPAHQMRPDPDQRNIVRSYTWLTEEGEEETYTIPQILHWKTANIWDPWIGMSPLDRLRGSVVLERQMRKWNYNRFIHNIPANLVFFTDKTFATDEDLDEVTNYIENRFAGSHNAGKPLILSGENWKLEKIDRASEEDVAFLAGLKFLRSEYSMVLGVPPSKLSDFSDAFRSNAKEQDRTYWEDTIASWHRLVLDYLNTVFLPRYFPNQQRLKFRFDYTNVKALAVSEFQVAQTQEILVRNGIVSRNEARAAVGKDERPEPEADQLLQGGQPLGQKPEPGLAPPGEDPRGRPEGVGEEPDDGPGDPDPEMDGKTFWERLGVRNEPEA